MPEDNKPFIEKLLGSNWRTTVWATVSGVAGFIATYPELLAPMPDYWEDFVKKVFAFLVAGGLIKLGLSSADVRKSKESMIEVKKEIEEIKHEKF